MVIWIIKADGSKEPFKVNKIKRTARRAGASPRLASDIVKEMARFVHDGMTSREILSIILGRLRREEPAVACRYDLKSAIMRLGVAGFNFEQLMAEILKEYGYSAVTNQIVQGFCVSHEIDIVGEKDGERFMVECKYHHLPGAYTGIKETLYTWARLQDLQKGSGAGKTKRFDKAWLVTNTKFSPDSLRYGSCQGIYLLGWHTPQGGGLNQLLERKSLYPVTVLTLDSEVLGKLAKNKLLLLKDLVRVDVVALSRLIGVSESRARKMQELSAQVCGST